MYNIIEGTFIDLKTVRVTKWKYLNRGSGLLMEHNNYYVSLFGEIVLMHVHID